MALSLLVSMACVMVKALSTLEHTMHKLTQAAYQALDELWGSIHTQCQEHAEPQYQASLWRMAGNICTGFALQHSTAQDTEQAAAFEWLAGICAHHQAMALDPTALRVSDKLKLAIVKSVPRMH